MRSERATGAAAAMASWDWAGTAIGAPEHWPACLKTASAIVLRSPVPMALLWGRDGLLIPNDAYAALAGLADHARRGQPVAQLWPERAASHRRIIDRCLAGESVVCRDLVFHRDRGHGPETLWCDIDYSPLPGDDGEPGGVLAVVTETTARVAAEERLRASEARLRDLNALRQSQKMEAMGQLTGGVAHDFNNLLTPIVGALDLLITMDVGGTREKQLIAGAAQSAERARALVQRLLAFARRQPLQPVAVDVGALINGMAGLLTSTLGPAIRLVITHDAGLPPALADANQLEMALLNLAVNARDAMPGGGRLTITLTTRAVPPGHPNLLPSGDYLCLSVADTGHGMDAATLARAVEPFFSTKGVGKGTGLGLSMVHGLTLQLGGTTMISSTPGQGTDVALWLPQAAPACMLDRAQPGSSPAARRGTVLLVDDEDVVRLTTAYMLTELGYDVVEAASGSEALAMISDGLQPDVLVTDHLMPGMTGTDLARQLRRHLPALKILVVSGYANSDGIAPDLPRLNKPFRSAELAAGLNLSASGW
ncbi:MAG: ATP-binding protein [Sphingomonadales bacterium]|jgi:PAS domain S-box-containing protein